MPEGSFTTTFRATGAFFTTILSTLLQKRLPPVAPSQAPMICSGAFPVSSLASEDSATASAAAGVAPVPAV